MAHGVPELHEARSSHSWSRRLRRVLEPPLPLVMSPAEPLDHLRFPMGRWNLYVGGAGAETPGYINVDLFLLPGVTVVADAEYLRFTIPALCAMAGGMEVIATGWRTGPTATLLVFTIEYAKLLLPWHAWRAVMHFALGWLLFPLRYLDLILLKRPEAGRIGNHCYVWYRKPATVVQA